MVTQGKDRRCRDTALSCRGHIMTSQLHGGGCVCIYAWQGHGSSGPSGLRPTACRCLAFVDALDLATELVPLAGTLMCWSVANSFEEVTLSLHGGGETPPFHGYAVRDVLEWGKFF